MRPTIIALLLTTIACGDVDLDDDSATTGFEIPAGAWEDCGPERTCSPGLICLAGPGVEEPEELYINPPSEDFCGFTCGPTDPCPEGPSGQKAACLSFPSSPGQSYCYIPCDQSCPDGMICVDLAASLQQLGPQFFCV